MMSSPREPLPAATWQVTAQQETVDRGPGGSFEPGVTVSFTTGAGHAGTVFVPRGNYSLASVRAAVAGQAALLDAVGQLSSDTPEG